ncbi:MAG: thiamine S protein [Methanotrichaceae archaeon]|nr:thiamine S protein [Methanotrichaceae archaeon]MDD1758392.1 thiamine S protein [Methanotrichaceae archaeon]
MEAPKKLRIAEESIEIVLRCLGINPVEVVVARMAELVPELDQIRDEDELKIIRIIHGG